MTLVQPLPRTTLPRPSAIPTTPSLFHQLLRGPRFRWWRPLLSLLVLGVLTTVLGLALGVAVLGLSELAPSTRLGNPMSEDLATPATMLLGNLTLAGFIPIALLSAWMVHRVRPGFLLSVTGRFRWGWLLRCVAVLLPLWAIYLTVSFLADPPESGRPGQWVILLVMALVLTPFQCAGEELLFRGWLAQHVGAYFRHPMIGLVVSTVVSAGAFALAHGSLHVWVLLDLFVFGAAASVVTWRTGGLEAGIAIHLVNNVSLFVATTVFGGYAESFVDTDTTGDPVSLIFTLVVQVLALALVLWQARRAQITRVFIPAPPDSIPAAAPSAPAIWIAPLGY